MELSQKENTKRIAKNTLMLYVRMLFGMLVSLYTSRVVLQALGVEDYGIYNVVGGVVAMFSLLSGSLSAAVSRFLTFELGRNDLERLKKVFSSALCVHALLALVVFVLSETIGVWFLNYQMNIPADRMVAANWVFQFSIFSFLLGLFSVPYNASIVSHERMGIFAFVGIGDSILQLCIVLFIAYGGVLADKLILYAGLLVLKGVLFQLFYFYYCRKSFEECRFKLLLDKPLLKEMTGFAGWNFLGSGSALLMTQGVNILINVFFGVALNAARGIANQVDAAVQQFVNNFTTAINPQITKSYASEDLSYMHALICLGSKYSFFLTWFFALPILLETDAILHIWLKTVPDDAPIFLRLTLCVSLISVISNTLVTSMLATGNIKRYQIIVGGLGLCIFPLSYFAYKCGFPVETAYIIHLCVFVAQLVARLFLLRGMIKLQIKYFWENALVKDFKVVVISGILPLILYLLIPASILKSVLIVLISFFFTIVSIYFFGMTVNEKEILQSYIQKIRFKL